LVRESYRDPVTTFDTNVIGTANLLEAARACPTVRAVLVITTDKVYKNREWHRPYREDDCLGGIDPYSASKACAEIVTASYRHAIAGGTGMAIATARAGNIIGGGDWSADRLIPDFVRAVAGGKPLVLRNPDARRPWQHVLAACHGYLLLAAGLLRDRERHEGSWNLGPTPRDAISVREIVDIIAANWRSVEIGHKPSNLYESRFLALDSTKANQELKWASPWAIGETVARSVAWYQHYYSDPASIARQTIAQINDYRAGLSHN
jgi:CDP-glucose 4,6-dehydratase